MAKEWTELTKLTGGADIVVERVRLSRSSIAIEGEFALPPWPSCRRRPGVHHGLYRRSRLA